MTTEPKHTPLKPCPFCWSTPIPHKSVTDRVACQNNSCWIYKTYIAIPDWNTRHEPLTELVGELVDALRNSNIEIQAVLETAKGLSDLNVEMLHLRHQANEAILTKAKALQPAAGE